jgi:hypothetical protein
VSGRVGGGRAKRRELRTEAEAPQRKISGDYLRSRHDESAPGRLTAEESNVMDLLLAAVDGLIPKIHLTGNKSGPFDPSP